MDCCDQWSRRHDWRQCRSGACCPPCASPSVSCLCFPQRTSPEGGIHLNCHYCHNLFSGKPEILDWQVRTFPGEHVEAEANPSEDHRALPLLAQSRAPSEPVPRMPRLQRPTVLPSLPREAWGPPASLADLVAVSLAGQGVSVLLQGLLRGFQAAAWGSVSV